MASPRGEARGNKTNDPSSAGTKGRVRGSTPGSEAEASLIGRRITAAAAVPFAAHFERSGPMRIGGIQRAMHRERLSAAGLSSLIDERSRVLVQSLALKEPLHSIEDRRWKSR